MEINRYFVVKMHIMDIQVEKDMLMKRLQKVNDLSLIQAIKHMVDYGLSGKEGRISIEQYNKEIDQANARMDAGKYISHDDVKKESASWLD